MGNKPKKTIQFIGTYYSSRGLCNELPNNGSRIKLEIGFKINKNIDGSENLSKIELESKYTQISLEPNKKYIVSLEIDTNIQTQNSITINPEKIIHITEIDEKESFLNKMNFDLVFKRISLRPSRVILENNQYEWELFCSFENDQPNKIIFKKNGNLIGNITSNGEIFALAKYIKDNERSKNEIKDVYYQIYTWSLGDYSIPINWTSKFGTKVTISIEKTNFKLGEKIIMKFIVENNDEKDLNFCYWQTPIESKISSNFLEIRLNGLGEKLKYTGIMKKRSSPTKEDYILIKPTKKRKGKIDITGSYSISPGSYTLQFKGKSINGLPDSNSLDFVIW